MEKKFTFRTKSTFANDDRILRFQIRVPGSARWIHCNYHTLVRDVIATQAPGTAFLQRNLQHSVHILIEHQINVGKASKTVATENVGIRLRLRKIAAFGTYGLGAPNHRTNL